MSAVDVVEAVVETAAPTTRYRPVSSRLLRSELGMVFRRRRNQAALAVLVAVPLLIAIAVKIAAPEDGPPFFTRVTENGVFVAFASLVVVIPLFLPLAISVVAGDAVAGEASAGTLRYLLTVPVSRNRLLLVKYASIVAFCFAAPLLVAAVGATIGLILFPGSTITLLSATQVSTADALVRLLWVGLYLGACMSAVGAIGLFVSTLTETPVAAMAATATLAVTSQVLDTVPQLSAIHPYLMSNWWLAFGDLLRDPIGVTDIGRGLLTAGVYVALFGSLSWARFSGKDVSS